MELMDDYENFKHRVRPAEPVRRNLSPPVIYTLLVLGILLSVLNLGIAVTLIAGNFGKTCNEFTELREEISGLRKVAGNFEKTSKEFTGLQAEISELRKDLPLVPPFNQWRRFNQRLYFFSSTKQTWSKAQEFCASMNSQLVVIHSAAEQEFIRWNRNCQHWIGLHDTDKEGSWRWVDGTDYDSNVKFWANNQPNGNENEDEDCVVSSDGSWHDWPCSSMHPPICEKPAE